MEFVKIETIKSDEVIGCDETFINLEEVKYITTSFTEAEYTKLKRDEYCIQITFKDDKGKAITFRDKKTYENAVTELKTSMNTSFIRSSQRPNL